MERLLPTLRWAALSTALYWVYVFAAVPWIEPQIDLAALSDDGPSSVESGVPLLRKRLRTWFAEDAWEVNEASKILETSQGIIVLRNYQNLPDGTVRLWPCSFVLFPNRPDVALERLENEAIVLQASQGAILRFDTPLDLRRARLGRLLGGKLVGPVAVRSGGRSPGPEDDLYIAAVDVDLSDDVLRSPGDVTFRWGRNQGRGQGLQVDMVMRNGADGAPSFDGIRALTLQERVWMELHLGDKLLRDSTPPPAGAKGGPGLPGTAGPTIKPAAFKPPAAPITAEPPIHAQSRGPFRFDLVDRQVKFRDDVVLSRPMPAGGTEQLSCDDLLLLFDVDETPAPGAPPPAETAGDEAATSVDPRQLKRMAFRELQAVGKTVKLVSPSRQLEVACGLLQWNDKTGWLSLGRRPPTAAERDATAVAAEPKPVTVRQAGNELEAPEIHLQFDRGARQLNRAVATGPGKLVAKPGKQAFAAVWRNRMEVVPEGNLHVVHLIGGASIDGEGTGDLSADLIRLWLFDASKPPEPVARLPVPRRAQNQWQPHHLEAIDRVAVRSNVVVGKLNRLELWFEHFNEEAPASPGRPEPETDGGDELVPPLAAGGAPGTTAALPGNGPKASSTAFGSPGSLPAAPGKSRRFTLQGDRFWGRIGIYAGKPKMIEGRGEGGIDLVEDAPQTAGSSTGMSGDAVQVLQDPLAGEVVTLVGKPARVRTESLSLEGDAIHFGRTKSELWVNGPGLLQMKLQGLVTETGAAAVRSPLEVRWKGGLHFDGLAARFETDVKAQWDGRALRTERLDVLLTERLDLSDGQAGNRTRSTVAKIHCPQDFFLESRAFGQGRLASVERMQARDLTIEAGTGFVVAQGPGWVVQLRPGRSAFDGTEGNTAGERQVLPGGKTVPVSPAPVGRSMLQYLQVTFQEELSGNFRQGHLRFHGRVETVYGPVEDWDDAVDPDRLGPQAFWMRCDLLGVRQVRIGEGKPTHELDALDDVQLEGREFSGAAARLSYNQAKDLLILEGDGRADARLIRQAAPGAGTSRFAARKILFWRSLDRVKIEDGRQADVDTATPPPTR